MKFTHIVLVCGIGIMAAACETMSPATYSNSAANVAALRNYQNTTINVASMTDNSEFDPDCRLVGPIEASGGRTVAEFVRDALDAELIFADVHSDNAMTNLDAVLDAATYSSFDGYWEFTLTLNNPGNGRSLTVMSHSDFTTAFSAVTACINSSQALTRLPCRI